MTITAVHDLASAGVGETSSEGSLVPISARSSRARANFDVALDNRAREIDVALAQGFNDRAVVACGLLDDREGVVGQEDRARKVLQDPGQSIDQRPVAGSNRNGPMKEDVRATVKLGLVRLGRCARSGEAKE